MANLKSEKEVWMNALRQTKEYRHQEDLDKAAAEGSKEFWPEDRKDHYKKHQPTFSNGCDYIEEAKIEIIDKITKHLDDVIFEMICEEMSNRYVFQEQNYLTEAGFELFQEEFFEFYHEHHGEILHEVMKNITNG